MLSFWVQNRHVYKCKVALCLLVFKLDFELQISFCVLAELTVATFTYNNVKLLVDAVHTYIISIKLFLIINLFEAFVST